MVALASLRRAQSSVHAACAAITHTALPDLQPAMQGDTLTIMGMRAWWKETFARWPASQTTEDTAGRLKAAAWRQYALPYITVLKARAESIRRRTDISDSDRELLEGAIKNLNSARDAAARTHTNFTGAASERTWTSIYAVEAILLKLAPTTELPALGLDVLAKARRHLLATDPRRVALEDILLPTPARRELDGGHRDIAVRALNAANCAHTTEKMQAHSFRNLVLFATLLLFLVAAGLTILGANKPTALQLCFPPDKPAACPASGGTPDATATQAPTPTPDTKPDTSPRTAVASSTAASSNSATTSGTPGSWDVFVVELVGLLAALLTGAIALRNLNGTSTPYAIPAALIFLKLPVGALAAVLGLLLINGGLIPGLDKLANQAQILAWAAIFGAGQQALTQFVDRKGEEVLNNVRGPAHHVGDPPGT